jgi:hypothetical protein
MKHPAFVVLAAIALCSCSSGPDEITANLKVAKSEAQVSRCEYVGSFKMNFQDDGLDESLATYKERMRSSKGFRRAVIKGANTIVRMDPNPAPLVKVNAYDCAPGDLASNH